MSFFLKKGFFVPLAETIKQLMHAVANARKQDYSENVREARELSNKIILSPKRVFFDCLVTIVLYIPNQLFFSKDRNSESTATY